MKNYLTLILFFIGIVVSQAQIPDNIRTSADSALASIVSDSFFQKYFVYNSNSSKIIIGGKVFPACEIKDSAVLNEFEQYKELKKHTIYKLYYNFINFDSYENFAFIKLDGYGKLLTYNQLLWENAVPFFPKLSISKDEAIKLAKENGLKKGVSKEWEIELRFVELSDHYSEKSTDEMKFYWVVSNVTEYFDYCNRIGEMLYIDACSGKVYPRVPFVVECIE
jgi:hypothetical protein